MDGDDVSPAVGKDDSTSIAAAVAARKAGLSAETRAALEKRLRGGRSGDDAILGPRTDRSSRPLSFAQERLWFLHEMSPNTAIYNRPLGLRLQGDLHPQALGTALNALVSRHEALRTEFPAVDGVPVCRVLETHEIQLNIRDLSKLPKPDRDHALMVEMTRESSRPFELASGPLVRATLFTLGASESVLLLVFHHIVFDASSAEIVLDELPALYDAELAGRPPELDTPPLAYADFASWQRDSFSGKRMEDALNALMSYLEGAPATVDLPTDRSRPRIQTFRSNRVKTLIPASRRIEFESLARGEGATLFMSLAAAFIVLLRRYTGQEDFVLGCPASERSMPQLNRLIGLFINSIVLRADASGNPSFKTLLTRVRDSAIASFEHRDVPFEKLVERLNPDRDLSRTPVFQVLFNVENIPRTELRSETLRLERVDVAHQTVAYDLTLEITPGDDGLSCDFNYNRDLFEPDTMERLARHFTSIVDAVTTDPDRGIDEVSFLSDDEVRRMIVEWNDTRRSYPSDQSIVSVFERRVAEAPDAVALVYEGSTMTYRELKSRADELAGHLRYRRADEDEFIAVCLDRSLDLVVALLGILKAGCAYVALDPAYPVERLAYMLRDSRAPLVLTMSYLVDRLPADETETLCIDSSRERIASEQADVQSVPGPRDAAYMIYTSGSTGNPKGAVICHRSVLRLLFGVDFIDFGPDKVHLLKSPISFDPSIWELFGAILHGARCVLFPNVLPTPKALGDAIERNGVTSLHLVSSLFNVVLDERPETLRSIQQLVVGGEPMSTAHAGRAVRLFPQLKLVNGFGQTEGTCYTTSYRIPPDFSVSARSVPIGRPLANTQVFILDERLKPAPQGVVGELYIAGDGVALRYHDAPGLNADRFIANPFSSLDARQQVDMGAADAEKSIPPDPLFATRDLCRYMNDGNIEMLGRTDRQVKVRGFRIELGEIESVLRRHPQVTLAGARVSNSRTGEKQIVAYVRLESGGTATPGDLRDFLSARVPEFMVPAVIVVDPDLPMTPSGKVDFKSLPETPSVDKGRSIVEPRTDTERVLAEIWRAVLNLPAIGVSENFFDLGGHSLLAARIFARIEDVLGKDLPLATLFEAPTIEQLARVVDSFDDRREWSPLIPIKPSGSRLPFFCIGAGDVVGIERLAAHMDADQPVYGLQAPGLDRKPPSYSRIEDLAELYLEHMQSVQPHGPYLIGGRCAGMNIGIEMATRLRKDGEDVALLIAFDPLSPPTVLPPGREHPEVRRIKMPLVPDVEIPWMGSWKTSLFTALRKKARYLRRRSRLMTFFVTDKVRYKTMRIRLAIIRANAAHHIDPYPGPITVLRAEDNKLGKSFDRQWLTVSTERTEIIETPGTHETMWWEPHIRETARILAERIDEVDRRARS